MTNWLDEHPGWLLIAVVLFYFFQQTSVVASNKLKSVAQTARTAQNKAAWLQRKSRGLMSFDGSVAFAPVNANATVTPLIPFVPLVPPTNRYVSPAEITALTNFPDLIYNLPSSAVLTTHVANYYQAATAGSVVNAKQQLIAADVLGTATDLLNGLITSCQTNSTAALATYTTYDDRAYFLNAAMVIATSLNVVNASGSVSSSMLIAAQQVGGRFLTIILNPLLLAILIEAITLFTTTLDYGKNASLWQIYSNNLLLEMESIQAELSDPTITETQLLAFFNSETAKLTTMADNVAVANGW